MLSVEGHRKSGAAVTSCGLLEEKSGNIILRAIWRDTVTSPSLQLGGELAPRVARALAPIECIIEKNAFLERRKKLAFPGIRGRILVPSDPGRFS
jgi:hypothetical protein